MKRLILAIGLACLLSSVTRAGEIHSTGAVAPPPPSTAVAGEIPSTGEANSFTGEIHTTGGEIPTTGATAPEESTTTLTIILVLLGIVP